MSKVAVIYWSGSGNTAAMAQAVAEGAKAAGAETELFQVSQISASEAVVYDRLALGCPAMGAEVLEESEFEPFFTELEGHLGGRRVALFGSYGWGDGEWMRTWEDTCQEDGAILACESVICNEAPDEEADASCQALGKALA